MRVGGGTYTMSLGKMPLSGSVRTSECHHPTVILCLSSDKWLGADGKTGPSFYNGRTWPQVP